MKETHSETRTVSCNTIRKHAKSARRTMNTLLPLAGGSLKKQEQMGKVLNDLDAILNTAEAMKDVLRGISN